jgi:L-malate glycosyltransferase
MRLFRLLLLKRYMEDLLIFPFVWAGRKKSRTFIPNKDYDVFFFFPTYQTGGMEKIHTQLAHLTCGRRVLIVFTRRSQNDGFLSFFRAAGHDIVDISNITENRTFFWRNMYVRGLFSGYINQQQQPVVVVNGQSNFAYKLSRWLKKDIHQIELIHHFPQVSGVRVPFIPFYEYSINGSVTAEKNVHQQYQTLGIASKFNPRVRHIPNGIALPEIRVGRRFTGNSVRVLVVGHSRAGKRVRLAASIAREARKTGLNIIMTFVGDVEQELTEDNRRHDVYCGNVTDPEQLANLYRNSADVLLITSEEEGMPLVMMEAMARGSVIIATPVGDIPRHITAGRNGYLFSSATDEQQIIREGVEFFRQLLSDPVLFEKMAERNLEQAYSSYGLAGFEEAFHSLIETLLK